MDSIVLTAGDLQRLEEDEFLNDNLVDFYLKLLTTDETRRAAIAALLNLTRNYENKREMWTNPPTRAAVGAGPACGTAARRNATT